MTEGVKPAARHRARELALQALYQWQLSGYDASNAEARFRAQNHLGKADPGYFHEVYKGVSGDSAKLDAILAPYLERPVKDVDAVALNVLRIATWELSERIDVPYKVVLNEAVDLTKRFGASDAHKFVNGVLDKLAAQLRPVEFSAK
ncbi:transcription antitermination factor NusB [Litorivicinus lipolyticus]|uniref:Transcription antitermination protein NusB n=1 Tax=Litorivicinus lipolyticus TaxID=418701 RepID=A0A5Q2QEH9_9GAMM|nr:transcription antitermination factor NusB [Litorivicinus lipolyticus]QGG79425.1 transcription antitermination factor NusB [Litorivicinus lipolyticus]